MEELQAKTGKSALTYGLLTGAVGIVFGFMLYSMDLHYDQGWGVRGTQLAILAAGIFLGIAQFKKANAGLLNISQSLKVGTGIALIAAILGIFYFLFLSNVLEPDYMDKTFEIAKVKAMEDNPQLTSEQMDQGIEMQKKWAWVSYPIIIIFNLIMGLIIGLIAGLIMKKK